MRVTTQRAFRANAAATDPVLEIKNLSVDYGYDDDPTHVLRQVSLTLNRGEVLGLAGESGCGKSTLAYAATRLLPAARADHGRRGHLHRPRRAADRHPHAERPGAAGHPLAGPRDRVPGRDELAQPGVPDRPADRRRHLRAPAGGHQEGGPGARRGHARARRHLRRPAARLPAPALGRHAAARDDRDGPRAGPAGADHGRADDGARRGHAAADRGADRGAARPARVLGHLHHARRLAADRDRRPHRDHVRRRDRRGRLGAGHVPPPAAPVLRRAAALVPAPARAAA